MTEDIDEKLKILEYSPSWLEFNLLSVEELDNQIVEFGKEEDTNTEHYRYRTFEQYIKSKPLFTAEEISNYISLAIADPDSEMGKSAIVLLLKQENLSNDQFICIAEIAGKFGQWANKAIDKISLKRSISENGLTDQLFEKLIGIKDGTLQMQTFENCQIQQIERLAKEGANKSVRNYAIQLLKRQVK